MEFKEFSDPESKDYDIHMSGGNEPNPYVDSLQKNPVKEQFYDLYWNLGGPEDFELAPYGITERELLSPTIDTIRKLQEYATAMKEQELEKKNFRLK